MPPQKSVAEVPRSILPRLTWNGSSTRTSLTASHSAPLPVGRKQKQRTQSWTALTWQPHSPLTHHSAAAYSTISRESGTSTLIAKRFTCSTFYNTSSRSPQPTGNPIRHNGVYVATFNSARRAFHASARRERDHHFDTLKFVQRLKDEGFSEEQAVAMMRVLNDVIQESIQNLTRTMVLREGQLPSLSAFFGATTKIIQPKHHDIKLTGSTYRHRKISLYAKSRFRKTPL